jgi:hypothetical protein
MNWLPSHGIPCSDDALKPTTVRLIHIHKFHAQKYIVNHFLSACRYTVLRIDLDLTPIEMIWS